MEYVFVTILLIVLGIGLLAGVITVFLFNNANWWNKF